MYVPASFINSYLVTVKKVQLPFLESNLINIFIFPLSSTKYFQLYCFAFLSCELWRVFSKFVNSVTEMTQEYPLTNPLTSFVNDTYGCIFVDITFLAGIPNLSDEKWEIRKERTKYVSFVATMYYYLLTTYVLTMYFKVSSYSMVMEL